MKIKQKIIIFLAIVLFITGLVIYFVILPTVNDIKKISSDIYAERIDLEKKYQRGQLLKKTIADFEKIKPQKDRLSSIFIVSGNELKFITDLEEIAALHKLTQNLNLQPIKNLEDGSFYSSPLEIKTLGGFTETLKYLKDLEKLTYYFNISSLEFRSDDQTGLISNTVSGKIYFTEDQTKQ
ncbi:MAG: hypothetical protein WC768_03955 [Patescibacteria group bacterium]|jgi:Tfp pilus assembly protein PilO